MSSNYETLYGVGLLDDLHNYFPALLYDSSSFGSVRDVLGYIQAQTRNRFDLFSYGLREYQSTAPPAPAPVSDVFQRRIRTSFASMQVPTQTIASTLPRPTPATVPTTPATMPSTIQTVVGRPTPSISVELSRILSGPEEDEEDEVLESNAQTYITNTLLSLLNLPPATLTRNYMMPARTMDQFLEPVQVRPTAEQIANNTTIGNLVSDTEHSCAICQDALTAEQQGRKLNACGHWFHKSCIDTWLNTNVHCPVCRHDIREPLRRENSPPVPSE